MAVLVINVETGKVSPKEKPLIGRNLPVGQSVRTVSDSNSQPIAHNSAGYQQIADFPVSGEERGFDLCVIKAPFFFKMKNSTDGWRP